MPSNVTTAVVFIVSTIAQLYLFVLLLRLLLPWFGADFRNPIAQAILKLTSPVVVPLRRIVPPVGWLDTATVLVAFIVQYITILLVLLIIGQTESFADIALTSLVNLVLLTLRLLTFAIVIRVILSWIAPAGYNPAMAIIQTLTDRILRPFRRIIPPMGGLDLSPLFAIIILMAGNDCRGRVQAITVLDAELATCTRPQGDDVILSVRVSSRAKHNQVTGVSHGYLQVRTTAAPADGKSQQGGCQTHCEISWCSRFPH